MDQHSFFDVGERLQSVSKMGDGLEILAEPIAWEEFRPLLRRSVKWNVSPTPVTSRSMWS